MSGDTRSVWWYSEAVRHDVSEFRYSSIERRHRMKLLIRGVSRWSE
jgi:hypothetical protein